jgi:nitrogen-specific signal transduction histidine kinase
MAHRGAFMADQGHDHGIGNASVLEERDCRVAKAPPDRAQNSGRPAELTNLIDNAIYAVGGTGRIDLRTRRDGEFFLVAISDNGGGIPPEVRPHVFEPFFTTKVGSGTGLGLVISHRIVVERHNGKIDFSTGPDGTQFDVRLPFESPGHA